MLTHSSDARLKENEHLFRYRAQFEGNFFRCVRARANDAKIVGMRNAILRNHLKDLIVHHNYCEISTGLASASVLYQVP